MVYADFSGLHEPQCKGIDNPGASDSDYELWTPHDGRFGENKCFLGMHKTYVRRKQDAKCYNGEEHEAVTRVEPCTCNEMDYECDIGYSRQEGSSGPCLEQETRLTPEEKQLRQQELWTEQCEEFGYYEVTQGYRKVPGNICEGGIDLSPYRYQCTSMGYFKSFFSFRSLFMIAVIGAICYYGWPVIEAVLLLLPIPDPNDMKEKAKEYGTKAMDMVKGAGAGPDSAGYLQEFGTPGTLQDDSGDDDEEDIGKDATPSATALDYDSDEKDEDEADGAQKELISLDGGAK